MARKITFRPDPVFEHLERHVDDLMHHLLRRPTPASYQRRWAPPVDVYQTEGEYVLIAEIAGLDARSVTIEIDEQEVAISGEREIAQVWAEGAHVAGAEGVQCLQLEIPCGEFERRLVLPTPVDASAATATFDRGMLTVRLPRVDRRPTRVRVDLNT